MISRSYGMPPGTEPADTIHRGVAQMEGLEPTTNGFGDHYSTN